MEWSFRVFWDFFGVCYNGKGTLRKIFYFMCGFGSRLLTSQKSAKGIEQPSQLAPLQTSLRRDTVCS